MIYMSNTTKTFRFDEVTDEVAADIRQNGNTGDKVIWEGHEGYTLEVTENFIFVCGPYGDTAGCPVIAK